MYRRVGERKLVSHNVGNRHGHRAAQSVDEIGAEPSRYPGWEGGDNDLIEVIEVQRIDDRLIWVGVTDPGLDDRYPRLLEPTTGGVCLLPSDGTGFALSPTGQVLYRRGGNEENHLGVIALRRGSDRSEEFIGFSRLMRHSEQTCHHTPRSDHVTVAPQGPPVKTSRA